ncbi:MAG: diaminobutyrate--2-oxoglutarate transaminase [Proteobacteria bacterium]|nr:MAG: diaminobutyrate--2-oxoglutarate transaminase [Pseudomonadota bacterium]
MHPIIEQNESAVRSYCRAFPTVFGRAEGTAIHGADGKRYIDFFAGAGTMNYGHNHPAMREALVGYVQSGGIVHGLDMATEAKCTFLEAFKAQILAPRELDYRVMFPGPTGTNAVEAALKLARKVTGRPNVVAFTNAFHGMTLGSLGLTGAQGKRRGAGLPLNNVDRMPFDGYLGADVDTIDVIRTYLDDPSSGFEAPAAFVVETVQGEGGVNVASVRWLQRLAELAKAQGALLIVDDVQVGCGRTGAFFSFEEAGLRPDIVCLSKSLSGFGLPFALTLVAPEHDIWSPGEHNGTFRGHNLAFVTATSTLEQYWRDDTLMKDVARRGPEVRERLETIAKAWGGEAYGRGFIYGLRFPDHTIGGEVSKAAFERGLLIETSGPRDEVLKFLAPLTTPDGDLNAGLDILAASVEAVITKR